jgi:metal-dependent amidase/aminoacylase/carboxypeptidase family protein
VDAKIERRMGEVVQSIAQGNGGVAEIKFYDRVPALVNDAALTKRSLPALERAAGASNVTFTPLAMAAYDFSEFSRSRRCSSFHSAPKSLVRFPASTMQRTSSLTIPRFRWQCVP